MQQRYDRCPNCMKSLTNGDDVCPHCGFGVSTYKEIGHELKPFTVLQNKYVIGRVIGVGGFGITYIGWDTVLQTYVAIKEYYPESFATRTGGHSETQVTPNESTQVSYDKGLKRYLEEAQNLSKFYQLQGIVSVKDFFYANGTGYMVMEYIDGIDLKQYLKKIGGRLPEATVRSLMKPVLESLSEIHSHGLIHRDISPDNVMVDKKSRIKLIDFGAARGQSAESDKTYTVILKHGYAPPEQYHAKGNQGPWTDIYSICATMYRMLTGDNPPNSIERLENDEYISVSGHGINVTPEMEYVLQKGLSVKTSDRYQNVDELIADLYGGAKNLRQNYSQTASVSSQGAYAQQNYQNQTNHSQASSGYSHNYSGYNQSVSEPKKGNTGLILGIIGGVVAVIAIIVMCVVFLGKDKDDKTSTETTKRTTTEAPTTEARTTEAPTTEAPTTEAPTTEEPTTEDTGFRVKTLNGAFYGVPEGFAEDTANSSGDVLSYISNAGNEAFVISASKSLQGYPEADIVQMFDDEVRNYYIVSGDYIETSYNSHTCYEWTISTSDGAYYGYSCVFVDEDVVVYIEYVSATGDYSSYYDIVNHIDY